MSNGFTTVKTDSFDWTKIEDTDCITIEIKEGENDLRGILDILKDNPGCNIVIYNIYSYKIFNSLIAVLSRQEYDGTVTFNLVDSDKNLDDLEKNEILDLFNIPSYVKIKGFLLDNVQNSFSTWAHNQGGAFKEILANHLVSSDRMVFEKQEELIKKFCSDYGNQIDFRLDSKTILNQIYRIINNNIKLARDISLEQFTGNFANQDNLWAEDPVEVYRRKAGTSDGRVQLLTLLTNNSVFGIDCVPVCGQLASGYMHEWNEFVDKDGKIYHYDLAFNIEGLPDKELIKLKERSIEEEYPWVKSKRPDSSITYVFKPGISNKEDKK